MQAVIRIYEQPNEEDEMRIEYRLDSDGEVIITLIGHNGC